MIIIFNPQPNTTKSLGLHPGRIGLRDCTWMAHWQSLDFPNRLPNAQRTCWRRSLPHLRWTSSWPGKTCTLWFQKPSSRTAMIMASIKKKFWTFRHDSKAMNSIIAWYHWIVMFFGHDALINIKESKFQMVIVEHLLSKSMSASVRSGIFNPSRVPRWVQQAEGFHCGRVWAHPDWRLHVPV